VEKRASREEETTGVTLLPVEISSETLTYKRKQGASQDLLVKLPLPEVDLPAPEETPTQLRSTTAIRGTGTTIDGRETENATGRENVTEIENCTNQPASLEA